MVGIARVLRRSLLRVTAAVAVMVGPTAGVGTTMVGLDPSGPRLVASVTPGAPGVTTTSVHLFAFNDFHGYIEPGKAGNAGGIAAGGAYQFYKKLRDLRAANPLSVTVGAGDLVGASPLSSAQFADEPTLSFYSEAGVDFASVGNHEFDKGKAEFQRKQAGGCNPSDNSTCRFRNPLHGDGTTYRGTTMRYLAANVIDDSTGQPLFPATAVKSFPTTGGAPGEVVKVGFIGLVLKGAPTIVTPSGVAGLTFLDEAATANGLVPGLRAQGVKTIVALIHQGGFQASPPPSKVNSCNAPFSGDITPIADALDPSISVIVSGHTHAEYNCDYVIPGGQHKLLTSALSFGRVITDIGLALNPDGSLVSTSANNVIVNRDTDVLAAGVDATYDRIKTLTDAAIAQSAPIANQVIGSITADITRRANAAGEHRLGDVIADAQLRATDATRNPAASAVIGFMNPGGVRTDLLYDQQSSGESPGQVTYGEAFAVQPFNDALVTKTMTGAQIKQLLEQQIAGCFGQDTTVILQISNGFSWQRDRSQPACNQFSTITLNGSPLDPQGSYRVTMNSFLATGGNGFTTFNSGTDPVGGDLDIDALVAYFRASSPVPPGPATRATLATGQSPAEPETRYPILLALGTAVLAGPVVVMVVRRRRFGGGP